MIGKFVARPFAADNIFSNGYVEKLMNDNK
jgi:hypothetical protein